MRFIPVRCLREGMISGRKLIGRNGELLLNRGSIIHASYISKIRKLGYSSIYIEDELSQDIEVKEIISDTLRFKTVNTVKDFYSRIENGQNVTKSERDNVSSLVNDILDKILDDRSILINMIDLKIFDDYTFFHSVNVGVLAMAVGAALNMKREQLYQLGLSSILHDIGKVFIPREILNKPGQFTTEEFEIMKSHSIKGYEYLLTRFNIPSSSAIAVLDHHERYDGSGYPNKKKGDKISNFGKIIAITDVYDALTSDRPYRKAMTPSEAIEYVMGGCDSHFTPEIVNVFMKKISPYPVGSLVNLSNNSIGIVMHNYSDCCLRPKIRILRHGTQKVSPYVIDLRSDPRYLDVTVLGANNSEFNDFCVIK
jgi:HD-GYP domain-containing protein (c-di-GMP phosphodiesterase class II)